MTYTEFKNKWLGKGIDFDGSFGFQCVDVYRMYCKEVLQIPQSPKVAGARNIWDTYLKEHFDKIINTKEAVPQQGDVIIWGMEPYGHIAVCDSANVTSFISFEQNWTELNGSGKTELRNHNYKNVLGWLKPKTTQQGETMAEEQKRILEFLNGKTEGDVREAFGALADINGLREKVKNQDEQIVNLKKQIEEITLAVDELSGKFNDNKKLLSACQKELATANEQVTSLTEQLGIKSTDLSKYRKLYETYNDLTGWGLIIFGIKKLFVKNYLLKKT